METIKKLDSDLAKAQQVVNTLANARAIAVAREAKRLGRGGIASIARELGVKGATISMLATRGRKLISNSEG